MNSYQTEQQDALFKAREAVLRLSRPESGALSHKIRSYLEFRRQVDAFHDVHFRHHCSLSCFQNRLSACCSKDSIVTFWADVMINAFVSKAVQLADLALSLTDPAYPHKCIYLGPDGCRWQLRPLMCALFLCDAAKAEVFAANISAQSRWEKLQAQANDFRWPDKPVLFDWLESYSMARGIHSPLMYINKSPGLLRIKRKAGIR